MKETPDSQQITLKCGLCGSVLTGPPDNPRRTVMVLCPECLRRQLARLYR